jgi:hypothetical protein
MSVGSKVLLPLPLPGVPDANQSIVRTADSEVIEVAQQVQLYAPNGLLKHPLVSPALSYLGGLPHCSSLLAIGKCSGMRSCTRASSFPHILSELTVL